MNDAMINPYAPPTSSEKLQADDSELGMWREGDLLVWRMGTTLPMICLLTGERANYSHPIHQIWQPRWVYSLLFFFVVPYIFVSPFVHRRIELNVPFGKTIYAKHRRVVTCGLAMILLSSIVAISIIISALYGFSPLSRYSGLILFLCFVTFVAGVVVTSSLPLHLDILKVEGNLVYLQNVHPNFLAQVPDRLMVYPIPPSN